MRSYYKQIQRQNTQFQNKSKKWQKFDFWEISFQKQKFLQNEHFWVKNNCNQANDKIILFVVLEEKGLNNLFLDMNNIVWFVMFVKRENEQTSAVERCSKCEDSMTWTNKASTISKSKMSLFRSNIQYIDKIRKRIHWRKSCGKERKIDLVLIWCIRSKRFVSVWRVPVKLIALALLTTISIPPNFFTPSSTARWICSSNRMSHWQGRQSPPSLRISSAAE